MSNLDKFKQLMFQVDSLICCGFETEEECEQLSQQMDDLWPLLTAEDKEECRRFSWTVQGA